jgi:hypothetical protein
MFKRRGITTSWLAQRMPPLRIIVRMWADTYSNKRFAPNPPKLHLNPARHRRFVVPASTSTTTCGRIVIGPAGPSQPTR